MWTKALARWLTTTSGSPPIWPPGRFRSECLKSGNDLLSTTVQSLSNTTWPGWRGTPIHEGEHHLFDIDRLINPGACGT
jgi:hypothetical protein